MGRLENKIALVTGGGSGIGKAIARAFAREHADVCIADINLAKAQQTAREVEQLGRKTWAIHVDVANMFDLDKMVDEVVTHFGRIDVLVNAAGILLRIPALDVTEADWDAVMNVNLKGLFFATQRVLPVMIKQGKGKIINIASTLGAVGSQDRAIYCAAKGGVINLTKAMAVELAPKNINVNAIGPGLTATSLTEYIMDDAKLLQLFLEKVPLGRAAQPEEIAAAAVYLASDESGLVTGHTLFVDGGFLAQ